MDTKMIKSETLNSIGVYDVDYILKQAKERLEIFSDWTKVEHQMGGVLVQCGLSSFFGTLNADSIKLLDDDVKVMIGVVAKSLAKLSAIHFGTFTWERVDGKFRNSPVMKEGSTEGLLRKSFKKTVFEPSEKKFTALSEALVDLTKSDLTSQSKIMKFAELCPGVLSAMEHIEKESHKRVSGSNGVCTRSVVDLVILQFPDKNGDFFNLSRLQLSFLLDCTKKDNHKHGINIEYDTVYYEVDKDVMIDLDKESKDKLVAQGESLFAPLPG